MGVSKASEGRNGGGARGGRERGHMQLLKSIIVWARPHRRAAAAACFSSSTLVSLVDYIHGVFAPTLYMYKIKTN